MANIYDLKLSEEKLSEIGNYIINKIRDARGGMRNMIDNMEHWDKLYNGDLPEKNYPWEGASNLNIPLIQSHVDTYHAHVNAIKIGVKPYVLINPPSWFSTPESKKVALYIQDMLEDILENKCEFEEIDDMLNLYALKNPCGIAKVSWCEEEKNIPTIVKQMELNEDGAFTETSETLDETKKTTYEGVKIELVDLRNFVVYPLTVAKPEKAKLIGDRFSLSKSELNYKVKNGQYIKSAVEKIMDNPDSESSTAEDLYTDDRYDEQGLDKLDTEEYFMWEVYIKYDINNDGIDEECLFTVESRTGTVVRARRYPYLHGKPPYVVYKMLTQTGQFFGRCIPQILEGCQHELNAIHNQRIDATSIAMTKAFIRRRSGSGVQDVELYPGATILVDDLDEVKEISISPMIPGFENESISRDYAERADGINDITMGKGQKGDKTLGEINITQNQGGIRFNDIIRRLQLPVAEIARQVLSLCYQLMSDEEMAKYQIEREMLNIEWKIVPHGNIGTANKDDNANKAVMLYQMLMSNPLVASEPMHIRRLTFDLLQAMERKDIDSYIGSEEELHQAMQQAEQKMMEQQQMQSMQPLQQPQEQMGGQQIGG